VKFSSILFLVCISAGASTLNAEYSTCFVPGQRCELMISQVVDSAKYSIDVQAYHLTNKKIIDALVDAKARGIKVRVILDKGSRKEASVLLNHGIEVWIDYKRAIAHNKVMIIDGEGVVTGSFNFTESAQKRNVENAIYIKNKELAGEYEDNFEKRKIVSLSN
jgi:phosphatidylserine/phosphatidylglycerophosphate/cardiolipin synthase-like enzyme